MCRIILTKYQPFRVVFGPHRAIFLDATGGGRAPIGGSVATARP
jgi:hypothetical protein